MDPPLYKSAVMSHNGSSSQTYTMLLTGSFGEHMAHVRYVLYSYRKAVMTVKEERTPLPRSCVGQTTIPHSTTVAQARRYVVNAGLKAKSVCSWSDLVLLLSLEPMSTMKLTTPFKGLAELSCLSARAVDSPTRRLRPWTSSLPSRCPGRRDCRIHNRCRR